MRLPATASDAEILAAVRAWVELLEQRRFEDAVELATSSESHWTPELLETVIRNYGFVEPRSDGRTFAVRFPNGAENASPRQEVWRFGDDRGHLEFDLPLNGEWSDVTALFDFQREGDSLVLELDDIHVL
jgi:hypothetical protein